MYSYKTRIMFIFIKFYFFEKSVILLGKLIIHNRRKERNSTSNLCSTENKSGFSLERGDWGWERNHSSSGSYCRNQNFYGGFQLNQNQIFSFKFQFWSARIYKSQGSLHKMSWIFFENLLFSLSQPLVQYILNSTLAIEQGRF